MDLTAMLDAGKGREADLTVMLVACKGRGWI